VNSARDNRIQIINPISFPDWDDLVLSHPDYSFFHSSAWAKTLFESYHYTPLYFAVLNENKLSAVVPMMEVNSFLTGKRGVSLPFTDYCEPIVNENIQFRDLWDSVIEYGKKGRWKSLEIRGGENLLDLFPPSANYFGHILELGGNAEELFNRFKDSVRRNVRKANREGVEVGIFNSLESVMVFCRLNSLTRRDHGLPPQPYNFFKNIYQYVMLKDLGFVALASYRGAYIAGAVFFHFGKKALFKYGASDRKYQHLRPNNLVMWEAIQWYCRRGYKSLCLGRTEPENEGLRIFKNGWGTQEHIMNYYKYDLRQSQFVLNQERVSRVQNMFFGKMPIPLLKIIGTIGYKHVG
jgi:hypothetical protein